MHGIIGLDHFKINCIIGADDEERMQRQDIYVDLRVEADFSSCVQSDNLQDTVDYRHLAEVCIQLAEQGRYHILEKFAYDVLENLTARFDIYWAWIKVKKPHVKAVSQFTIVELQKFKQK